MLGAQLKLNSKGRRMMLVKHSLMVALTVAAMGASAFAEVTFEWMTVGNPGNAADPEDGDASTPGVQNFGSVANEYRIAKHEVTNDQYAAFLNAVATTDTNALYNSAMDSDAVGGITQSGSAPNLTYTVKSNMGKKPVIYATFFDAMRFVNWLHNGQPTGAQDSSTTEDGVYAISDGLSEMRAVDAQFFIPTENEWYKAAYHQPSVDGGDTDDYWLYPTAGNAIPTVATANASGDIGNPGTNVANYGLGAEWNGEIGNVTTVGSAGAAGESHYGTSDQGGNVFEWTETVISSSFRVLRGGAWMSFAEAFLRSSHQAKDVPPFEDGSYGFRVASPVLQGSVPAVGGWALAVMVLALVAGGTLVLRRRIVA